MDKITELQLAYEPVFDENGQIRSCGRHACIYLIQVMKKYTSENVGDEETGMINVEKMKSEYARLTAWTFSSRI